MVYYQMKEHVHVRIGIHTDCHWFECQCSSRNILLIIWKLLQIIISGEVLTHVMLTTCRALEQAGGITDLSY